jgi:hypothetical protein
MTTPMKIVTLVVIPIVVLAVGLGIFLAVSNDSGDNPDETLPPVEDTTNPNESETDNTDTTEPTIPDIEPDESESEDHKQETPGDITIDVLEGEDNNEWNDEPTVDGEVVIIPGAKGEDE